MDLIETCLHGSLNICLCLLLTLLSLILPEATVTLYLCSLLTYILAACRFHPHFCSYNAVQRAKNIRLFFLWKSSFLFTDLEYLTLLFCCLFPKSKAQGWHIVKAEASWPPLMMQWSGKDVAKARVDQPARNALKQVWLRPGVTGSVSECLD